MSIRVLCIQGNFLDAGERLVKSFSEGIEMVSLQKRSPSSDGAAGSKHAYTPASLILIHKRTKKTHRDSLGEGFITNVDKYFSVLSTEDVRFELKLCFGLRYLSRKINK